MSAVPPRPPIAITKSLSCASIRIFPVRKQLTGETLEGPLATGFLWTVDGTNYLITNWHNVTGWDPVNNKALSKVGFTPNALVLHLGERRVAEDGRQRLDWTVKIVSLFDGDEPTWLEHPIYGNQVDVVALDLGTLSDNLWTQPVNAVQGLVDFIPSAGDEAFVLGFPKGLDGGFNLPIWKRASIASEPDFDLGGLPKILIDTATRPGMSGSPVIVVNRGFTRPRDTTDYMKHILGTSENFLGVYSGRVDDDPLGVQLGVVWKGQVIDEIIRGGAKGRTPFT